jgi:hypothetical protein
LRKWPKVLGFLVLLGWLAILVYPSPSQQTAEVLVAKSNIFVGERVLRSDFETRSLFLGDIESAYLRVNEIPEDATASREILAGELLAKTAIGRTEQVLIPLALPLAQAPASQIRVGCSVNVWATAVHLGTVDGLPEPIALGDPMVLQGRKAFEGAGGVTGAKQSQHSQGLIQGRQQTRFAEVIGGDEAIEAAPEHPQARPHAEGGADTGDGVLFG